MARKLKLTFEKGGTVYADLLTDKAPKTCEMICAELPRTYPMIHGRYAGPAMFFNTDFTEVPEENYSPRKWDGQLTLTLGTKVHPVHACHVFYSYKLPIEDSNNEIYFAQIPPKYFEELETIGNRVWQNCPENVTIEVVDE